MTKQHIVWTCPLCNAKYYEGVVIGLRFLYRSVNDYIKLLSCNECKRQVGKKVFGIGKSGFRHQDTVDLLEKISTKD